MADMTLCASQKCTVRTRCKRNADCPQAIEPNEFRQSYAYWNDARGGPDCTGFIDANAPDWRKR